jgi:hypothetical protein
VTDERWAALVAEVAKLEGVADALAAGHIPDDHGRCQGCASHSVTHRWPCSLRRLAEAARRSTVHPIRRPQSRERHRAQQFGTVHQWEGFPIRFLTWWTGATRKR